MLFLGVGEVSGKMIILNNRFFNISASYGGVIYLARMVPAARFQIEQNIFDSNTALQGGAIFYSLNSPYSFVANNLFVNNTASLYGPTFAGIADKLRLLERQSSYMNNSHSPQPNNVQLWSGDVFPTFGVFIEDIFSQHILPSEFFVDFLVADATVLGAVDNEVPEAAVIVGYEEVMLQGNDAAWFTSLQIVGSAGEYRLLIRPRINYDPLLFNARVNFTLKECASPKILQRFNQEPYPRCIESESAIDSLK
jgi:hypothetical protein